MSLKDLSELVGSLHGAESPSGLSGAVQGIQQDSRQIERGDLFVAVPGMHLDGHRFISDAAERGALAAVVERPALELALPQIVVPDARLALAELAAAWHDYPARSLIMIGVTGTDGKTTTTNMVFSILRAAQIPAGMISTVEARIGAQVLNTGFHVTTPEAMDVQAYLADMVRAGLTHCVLEATSHGLAQHRVARCEFDIGVITNITHEHLDFHGSHDEYFNAKARLFHQVDQSRDKSGGPGKLAILNVDDSSYDRLQRLTQSRQITYGRSPAAMVRLTSLEETQDGIQFRIESKRYSSSIASRLLGGYNAWNILAAFAATVNGLNIAPDVAIRGVEDLRAVPGRMERIDLGQPFLAIVDFAHTPNALRKALQAARKLGHGQLIAVFGSAGLRDREKRRMMSEISAELADVTVLTAEDPRTESLQAILDEMVEAAKGAGARPNRNLFAVPDRGDALRFALELAEANDIVIACGKGHEQSMCFGDVEYPWDDRMAMRAALAEVLGKPGPEMPILPTSAGGAGPATDA